MAITREEAEIGRRVIKQGGDYHFIGVIAGIAVKRSGAVRVVVENDDGILHIFNLAQLDLV